MPEVRSEAAPRDPTPARARPAASAPIPTREVTFIAELVAVEGRMVRITGPQGELVLPVRARALEAGQPAPGDTVRMRVGVSDPCGEYQVLGWSPVPGLKRRFGKVLGREADTLRVLGAKGEEALAVNSWSELEEEVVEGAWVGAEIYSFEDRPTVLTARAYPGEVWDLGTLTEETATGFTVEGLAGPRCWKGSVGSFTPGDLMEVRGAWDPTDGFRVRAYTPKVWPQPFRGRLDARGDGKLVVSDLGTMSFGALSFTEPRRCDEPCEALTVGDVVEVEWRRDGDRRVAETLRPAGASKIARGELELRTDTLIRVRLPQDVRREWVVDADTVFATGAAAGDKIVVVSGPPTRAALVTRE